jgi:hypothetical protein
LNQHEAVKESAVLVREDRPGEKRLVAYVVRANESQMLVSDLTRHLKEKLPEYMVPAIFVELERLPLSNNGKIDRKAFPPPFSVPNPEYVAPRDAVEELLAVIWAEVLHVQNIGMYDNFFELGGHSLLATTAHSRIVKLFKVELPLLLIFEHPTISALADEIKRRLEQREDLARLLSEIEDLPAKTHSVATQ